MLKSRQGSQYLPPLCPPAVRTAATIYALLSMCTTYSIFYLSSYQATYLCSLNNLHSSRLYCLIGTDSCLHERETAGFIKLLSYGITTGPTVCEAYVQAGLEGTTTYPERERRENRIASVLLLFLRGGCMALHGIGWHSIA
jgi:hypothetical protein